MLIPVPIVAAALILALVDEAISDGKNILGWAVVLICAALLWGRITL